MFDTEAIAKTFTRYIVPGIVFIFLAVVAPISLVAPSIFFGKEPQVGSAQIVIISILTGYVLDAVRGYRWTLSWRAYNEVRADFIEELAALQNNPKPNPDYYLAGLWIRDEGLYNRIFVERAEWVMILETALSLWLSALVLVFVGFYIHSQALSAKAWLPWLISPLVLGVSLLASKNGIDRMKVHNLKVLEAMKNMTSNSKKVDENL